MNTGDIRDEMFLHAITKIEWDSVNWQPNDVTVVDVSSTGVVTAKKTGSTTIIASMVDIYGVPHEAYCDIYVYMPEGEYFLQNK